MGTLAKVLILLAGLLIAAVVAVWLAGDLDGPETWETEVERIEAAQPTIDLFQDDRLEQKQPPFIPGLIDSREWDGYQLNASAAVMALDIVDLREDREPELFRLYSSYTEAAAAMQGHTILPSINLISGKAKQFDDGLYAALDHWMIANGETGISSTVRLVRQLTTLLHPQSEAYAWLLGSLQVAGFLSPEESSRRPPKTDDFIRQFLADEFNATPHGFYDWSEGLKQTWRFNRYLQLEWDERGGIAQRLAGALIRDEACMEQYRRMVAFYSGLTNPPHMLSLVDLVSDDRSLGEIAESRGVSRATVAFLPSSTSHEVVLVERLFPMGLPPGADLMFEFVRAIRDGKVDLKPTGISGWYDWQVYALETFLLPGRGAESDKLLLSAKYKQRMLEAFKAIVTKHRETHIRQGAAGKNTAGAYPTDEGAPESRLGPRLRVEPNPTYYLREARAYAFLARLLPEFVELSSLHGYTADGPRPNNLEDELRGMKDLFYGLHLVSCEDIGMQDQLEAGELEQPIYCRTIADDWLKDWREDPDLAVDTRVAVPIYRDRATSRWWCNLGVHAVKLNARWARPPSWRKDEESGWQTVDDYLLADADYILLVDDFAEVTLGGRATLARTSLRRVCNLNKTKAAIVKALEDRID